MGNEISPSRSTSATGQSENALRKGGGDGEIVLFDPLQTKERSSVLTSAIDHAKRIRDWVALGKAIDLQIREQSDFVAWWKAHVRGAGQPEKNCITPVTILSADQAEAATGISKMQVSRWGERLADAEAYAKQLFGAGWRAAMNVRAEFDRPLAVPVAGKFSTVIIDPPWPMAKIGRDVRRMQDEHYVFEYPTMSVGDIEAFPAKDCFAEDCHVFIWTTQKFLPATFDLLPLWGLHYVFTMVWHKAGGFQPVRLPQYNCEFVVYGRQGSPRFSSTKAFDCCFSGVRREHSRKPDEFYDMVRRVTPAPRIDVFSRERREGFEQYGNESGKF